MNDRHVNLSHGGGGRAMHGLIEGVFLAAFGNTRADAREDQARIPLSELTAFGDRLAFTTDSYVVDPLFFPGADIGALAVAGTVNDLAVGGARPLFLSCAMVIEEGLPVATLQRVAASMQAMAQRAGVTIVTGDTKVVERGAADKLFINTAGIGVIPHGIAPSASKARPGDVVIVSGSLGDHGVAILVARNQLALEAEIASDCQPLHGLVAAMLAACPGVRCLRDATRGGIATVLNEFARDSHVGIRIREDALPLREPVRGACEILGLDPLYLANEGKLVAVVPPAGCRSRAGGDAGRTGWRGRGDYRAGDARSGEHGGDADQLRRRAHCRYAGRRAAAADLLRCTSWALATAVVDACAERAAGARVLRVRVEVGQLVAVLPDALRFCFDVCAQGTVVEGAAAGNRRDARPRTVRGLRLQHRAGNAVWPLRMRRRIADRRRRGTAGEGHGGRVMCATCGCGSDQVTFDGASAHAGHDGHGACTTTRTATTTRMVTTIIATMRHPAGSCRWNRICWRRTSCWRNAIAAGSPAVECWR